MNNIKPISTPVTSYDNDFFDDKQDGAFSSARVIVPLIMELVNPLSVIDIGCGRGVWLKVFSENGVDNIRGIDGSYVDISGLVISRDSFSAIDLSRPFNIDGKYDLAVCLEVVEHVPDHAGKEIIKALTSLAPIVLFSAAISGQGGTYHVNEQWPEYWDELFSIYGYSRIDVIRPKVIYDNRVEWWYRQNIVLYASERSISESAELRVLKQATVDSSIEWIHASVYKNLQNRYGNTRKIWHELKIAISQALQRRIQGEISWINKKSKRD